MPSSSYRRRLREHKTTNVYLSSTIYDVDCVSSCDGVAVNSKKTELEQKFYDILDMIINQNAFSDVISSLDSIKEFTGSLSEYCKKLDVVLDNLCGIIGNIGDSVGSSIIQNRIDYIRTLILDLPDTCVDYRPLSDMIMNLIATITTTFDINTVTADVRDIHTFVDVNYDTVKMDTVKLIQETLIDIICNIEQGNNTAIIADRIQYVRTKLFPLLAKE